MPKTSVHAVSVDRVEPPFARPADAALDRIVAQAELLRAQLDAEELARRGDHQGAVTRLYQSARVLDERGHAAEATAARELGATMRDETAFRVSAGYRKSMQAGLRRGASTELDGAAEATLRSIGKTFRTEAQDAMADSFGAGSGGGDGQAAGPGRSGRSATPREPGKRSSAGTKRRRSKRW
ncbi:MAG TPA: hypothetical protein VFP50_04540 [Anaeromyxobacteraceae bacterium]|nr:hypothetical protein [Anaeromyxobacteraceae bacterium]